MYKFIPAILFFVMVSYGAALGENFEATDFRYTPQVENSETAVLVDETGNEWLVEKGDRVYEWTVTDITPEYVELTQYQNERGYPMINTIYFHSNDTQVFEAEPAQ